MKDASKVKPMISTFPFLAFQTNALKTCSWHDQESKGQEIVINYQIPSSASHTDMKLKCGSEGTTCRKCTCYRHCHGILLSWWTIKKIFKRYQSCIPFIMLAREYHFTNCYLFLKVLSPSHHPSNTVSVNQKCQTWEFPTSDVLIYMKSKTIQIILPRYDRKILHFEQVLISSYIKCSIVPFLLVKQY